MTPKKVPTTKAFRVAVDQLLKLRGRGSQQELAAAIRLPRQKVNDMLTGRRPHIADNIKDRIAEFFGFHAYEMIYMGAEYVRTGSFFPHHQAVHHLEAHSEARAEAIYMIAANDAGMGVTAMFQIEALKAWHAPGVENYLAEDINDGQLYEAAVKTVSSIISKK